MQRVLLRLLGRAAPIWVALQLCSVTGQQEPNDCRDSIGIPCSTIQYKRSQWQIGRISLPIAHSINQETVAYRSDGSFAVLTDRGHAYMYAAPSDQVIRIDNNAKTISHRPPIIWHDRPYRRSKDGDGQCATGILHFGTDFHLSGDTVVAGISVKTWERGDGWFWHEEEHLAPSLDCAVLKSYSIRRNFLLIPTFINSAEALSVRLGEPDQNLFAAPANYQEVKDPTEDRLRAFVMRNGSRQ